MDRHNQTGSQEGRVGLDSHTFYHKVCIHQVALCSISDLWLDMLQYPDNKRGKSSQSVMHTVSRSVKVYYIRNFADCTATAWHCCKEREIVYNLVNILATLICTHNLMKRFAILPNAKLTNRWPHSRAHERRDALPIVHHQAEWTGTTRPAVKMAGWV